ncbi:kinesin light chain 4-like [Corticium candelabrum]|uniref:kinesin light chain 4-like n=1 Tax=Corticium candelabrum TaxID=121492 RepID=UPI002E25C214|nr:kinesin light chain 4-like [Corticium candelabrum]XP_062499786.1 kinesin light chain 4-like [Corticium candelabrum]
MEIRREIIELQDRGVTLGNEGNFGEAAKVLEQVKQMAEENLDIKDELRLGVLGYLGKIYIGNGDYMKAQALLEDILSVQRQETPNVLLADTLYDLGRCYCYQGKSMDAIRLLEESLSIYQKYVSPNDIRVTNTMTMLGTCFMDQGNLSDAERILRESLEIIKSARPENPVAIVDGQFPLARCLYQRGKQSESIELTKECVRILKSHFHPKHFRVATG